MNFVNGFPLFASSIGVLHHGRPVAGAIWCSTGHQLRPGVYHARLGGGLQFEQRPVPRGRPSVGVTRRLSAGPAGRRWWPPSTDARATGSTAIECAFAAAQVFAATLFWGPSIWDVAAGVTLVREGGGVVLTRGTADGWQPFERFEPPSRVKEDRAPTLRDWRRSLAMGSPATVEELTRMARRPRRPWWSRLRPGSRRR
jgi:myo-inositol-1(or 4)-monophosphatase